MTTPLIEAAGIEKSYVVGSSRVSVLRGLDLDVAQGEMVAIVGASGVGKSTLLHVLGGLDTIDKGSIRIGDAVLFDMKPDALVAFRNRHVGFVFQFHHLLPEFTALENTGMPMRIAKRPADERDRRAAMLLERVGLGERFVHKPGMLSGGEQQRVAIARAGDGAIRVAG
jgi:lipoprotein-releasing system ATP-binding protein